MTGINEGEDATERKSFSDNSHGGKQSRVVAITRGGGTTIKISTCNAIKLSTSGEIQEKTSQNEVKNRRKNSDIFFSICSSFFSYFSCLFHSFHRIFWIFSGFRRIFAVFRDFPAFLKSFGISRIFQNLSGLPRIFQIFLDFPEFFEFHLFLLSFSTEKQWEHLHWSHV